MVWPLPSKLQFASEAGALITLEVEVQLLDGQLIHGVIPAGENLSEISELKLIFMGRDITLPVADIRSVGCSGSLIAGTDSDITVSHEQHLEHEESLIFHVLFIDG